MKQARQDVFRIFFVSWKSGVNTGKYSRIRIFWDTGGRKKRIKFCGMGRDWEEEWRGHLDRVRHGRFLLSPCSGGEIRAQLPQSLNLSLNLAIAGGLWDIIAV
jgi:hypothetical protein